MTAYMNWQRFLGSFKKQRYFKSSLKVHCGDVV
jgi:hypothetical protein